MEPQHIDDDTAPREPIAFEMEHFEDAHAVPTDEADHAELTRTASSADMSHVAATAEHDQAPQNASFSSSHSFAQLPVHLKPIARVIRTLQPADLLTISEMTQRVASRELYSLLPYVGSNWYLPEIHPVGDDDPQWGFQVNLSSGVTSITISGRRLDIKPGSWLLRAAVLCLLWYALYLILGSELMIRGGYVFDPLVTLVVSSIVGGLGCRLLEVPPLLGVLWIAIMWANIPYPDYLTSGIDVQLSKIVQRIGLTIVLARAGFSLSIRSVKPHLCESLLLGTIPYGVQAVVHSLMTKSLYHNDNTWSFLEGCLIATVAPAIVVPGILSLQDRGYGRGHGPLSLMLSAVSIEVCCGVWAANFIIGLLFDSTPLATAIVLGPVQFIGGIIIGIVHGVGFYYLIERIKTTEAERLPNGMFSKEHINNVMLLGYAIFLLFTTGFVFFGYHYKLAGGGAVACVFFSATVAHMWIKDDKPELLDHKTHFGMYLANTWDIAVMPALFSMVGVQVNLRHLFNSDFTPRALACMAVSTSVRSIVVYAIQLRSPYDWKQKLLVCGGYLGKATAQAAIGPTALSNVHALIAVQGLTAELAEQEEKAERVLNMAMLHVLFNAMLAAIVMTKLGPRILPCTLTHR